MSRYFLSRKPRAHRPPNAEPASVGVNVTVTERDPVDDALEYLRHDDLTAHIGKHLPNAGKDKPSQNLKAARAASVLDRYCDYLQGTGPTPDLIELVDACRFAAESLRDGVVIG